MGPCSKGPYIKYVGGWEGGGVGELERSVFAGLMKYLGHILMGHEKFLKSFDGPENIFLSSIFIFYFLS